MGLGCGGVAIVLPVGESVRECEGPLLDLIRCL